MPRLSMPLFVDPADVILRMQLSSDLSGVEDIVRSGIIGAQLHVERILNGKLSRQVQDCQFYINADAFSGIQPGGMFRLEVPSGFIRSDADMVVTASQPTDFTANTGPFSTFEAVDADYMEVDASRGYVLLDAATYPDRYVRVQCETGFEDGTVPLPVTNIDPFDADTAYTAGNQVVYNGVVYTCVVSTIAGTVPSDLTVWTPSYVPMEQIPMALTEAIIALVPMVFNQSQTTKRSNEAKEQYKVASDHAAMLLQSYVRTRGFTFRPL
jgi:hypothetical protein